MLVITPSGLAFVANGLGAVRDVSTRARKGRIRDGTVRVKTEASNDWETIVEWAKQNWMILAAAGVGFMLLKKRR